MIINAPKYILIICIVFLSVPASADSGQHYIWDKIGSVNGFDSYAAWSTASKAGDKTAVLTKYVTSKL